MAVTGPLMAGVTGWGLLMQGSVVEPAGWLADRVMQQHDNLPCLKVRVIQRSS